MDDVVRLGFAVVLLLVTLNVAMGFMAQPMAILRRAGVLRLVSRAVRWFLRNFQRGVVGLFRLVTSRRRRRVRRPLLGAFMRLFK